MKGCMLALMLMGGCWGFPIHADDTGVGLLRSRTLKVPCYFVPNTVEGKTGKRLVDDDSVVALVQTRAGRVLFTPTGAFVGMAGAAQRQKGVGKRSKAECDRRDGGDARETVVMKAGFAPDRTGKSVRVPRLVDESKARTSFFVGSRDQWQANLPTYRKLVYEQVWDGIDLDYLAYQDRLEFRLCLAPFSDPQNIVMETGGESLRVSEDGALIASLNGAELHFSAPCAFQSIADRIHEVQVSFRVLEHGRFGFDLGTYDVRYPLVIDPDMTWSSYLGGPGGDFAEKGVAIALDSSSCAVITGSTGAADFPTTTGAFETGWSGYSDVFVTKVNSTGTDLIFSLFLGGSEHDSGAGIAVGASGDVYVTGYTHSPDFPVTTGAFDEDINGSNDVFVTRINPDGTALLYSTFLGGTSSESGNAIAIDDLGYAYVTGYTSSNSFPTTPGAYDVTADDFDDVFVTKLAKNGTSLVYSTYLGEDGDERGQAIAVDASGYAYITGTTDSADFPTTLGAFDSGYNDMFDAFVTKVNLDGSGLSYSTFLGGTNSDEGAGIAVDDSGNALITGETGSSDFPTTVGAFDSVFNGGAEDAFVAKLNSSGSGLIFSGFLGGQSVDRARAVAVDGSGNAYVAGETISSDFPITPGAFDGMYDAYGEGFVTKVSASGKNLIYATFLGGEGTDRCRGIAVNAAGLAFVTGETNSLGFPTTPGAFSRTQKGSYDTFVSALNASGSQLVLSTLVGGTGDERGQDIAVRANGFTYVTGDTGSEGFPTTSGAFAESFGGSRDAFVSVFNAAGDDLVYSTFLGGSGDDRAYGLAVDLSGNIYLTGRTESDDFPTTSGAFETSFQGYVDAYVTKIGSSGDHLVYSSYLGHSALDVGRDIALNENGNALVVGYTSSDEFPTTPGAFDRTLGGGGVDAFVAKFNPNGSGLVYASFLGHSDWDQANAVAIDAGDRAIVMGYTRSPGFPTTAGAFAENISGNDDVFVTALNPTGTALSYSTFLGGADNDWGEDMVLDPSGRAIVTGATESADFPCTPGAFSETLGGDYDGFVTGLSSDGSSVSFSTFLGGSASDHAHGVALDPEGRILVTGSTRSTAFPTTSGAHDETYNEGTDAFLSRFNATATALTYSTYLGGSSSEVGYAIASDSSGNVYVTGQTRSHDFPTTSGGYDETPGGYGDSFVTRLFSLPLQPVEISGSGWVCTNQSGEGYIIDEVTGATSYTWSVTGDATIVGGQGTTAITVDFGLQSSIISVTAENASGSSTPQTLAVTVYGTPAQPGVITGSSTVCQDATDVVYSTAPASDATSYTWSVTSGASIVSGQGTPTVTVDFAAASAIVSVIAENPCESSVPQSTVVTVISIPEQPGAISGPTTVCQGDFDVVYAISPVPGATSYTWTVPVDAQLTSGQGTSQVHVDFGTTAGDVWVTASNACGIGPAQTLGISVHTPVVITQHPTDITVCPGALVMMTAAASGTGPLTYRWYRDGAPMDDGMWVSGSHTDTLIFHILDVEDEGVYDCMVSNFCGSESTDSATLIADGPLDARLWPPTRCQGLNPLAFTGVANCARPDVSFAFNTSPPTGFDAVMNVITISVDPPPSQTIEIHVTITDDLAREVDTATALLLVSENPLYFDLNGDLCNNLRDLWLLCEDWRQFIADDPNGDGIIDVRDYLYINLDDPLNCGTE